MALDLTITEGSAAAGSGTNFQNIYEDVINRSGLNTDDTDLVARVKGYINNRYEEIADTWPFQWLYYMGYPLETVAKYTTGTVDVTNLSATVTGNSTVWTSAMVGYKFKVTGFDEIYEILSVDTTAQTLVLGKGSVNAEYNGETEEEASYTIYKDVYTLPSDCKTILNIFDSRNNNPITKIGAREQLYSNIDNFSSDPIHYAPSGISSEGVTSVRLIPPPYRVLALSLNYAKKITTLTEVGDEPLIPIDKRYLLKWGAMADVAYHELKDTKRGDRLEAKFVNKLNDFKVDAAMKEDLVSISPEAKHNNPLTRAEILNKYYLGDVALRL